MAKGLCDHKTFCTSVSLVMFLRPAAGLRQWWNQMEKAALNPLQAVNLESKASALLDALSSIPNIDNGKALIKLSCDNAVVHALVEASNLQTSPGQLQASVISLQQRMTAISESIIFHGDLAVNEIELCLLPGGHQRAEADLLASSETVTKNLMKLLRAFKAGRREDDICLTPDSLLMIN